MSPTVAYRTACHRACGATGTHLSDNPRLKCGASVALCENDGPVCNGRMIVMSRPRRVRKVAVWA